VTAPERAAGSFHLALDHFQNVTLAHEEDGRLIVETRVRGTVDRHDLGPGAEPCLAFDATSTLVAYALPPPAGEARRIHLAARRGGQWTEARRLSSGDGEDGFPSLQLGRNQEPVLAWRKVLPGGASRIWFRRPAFPAVDVGRGESPTLVLDAAGRAHIFFLRDGDIFQAREESSARPAFFPPAVKVTDTPFLDESAPRAVFDGTQIHLAYARRGTVFLANDSAGDFTAAVTLASGGAENPSLAVTRDGTLAVAFEREGEIYTLLGTVGSTPPPARVTTTPEVESQPQVGVDSFANLFVVFRRGDALFYATDAGPPRAAFDAQPARGEAPLEVRFTDRSTGDVTGWSWDFGDGSTSRARNPVHTYAATGQYLVRLRVGGPGGESPLSREQLILVLDPSNEMRVSTVRAFPGQRGVNVPVLASHDGFAQGFTIAARFEARALDVRSVEYLETNTAGHQPELFAVRMSEDPDEPYFTVGMLFDVQPPFDGRTLPPGPEHRIVNIVVDVARTAVPGTLARIELANQIGRPPLSNIFTVNGRSVFPLLTSGGVEVARMTFPPPRFFLRGDTDGNGQINLSDPIALLRFLFSGGLRPACADAADVTDDGRLDVADAAFALDFLFRSGRYPQPPYPDPGMDPTADELEACDLR
jgi:PKD repeat protein